MFKTKTAVLTTISLVLTGLLLPVSFLAQANHEVNYTCENACIVVIDPQTGNLSITDCCGGFIRTKVKKHPRFFDEK